ncbi:Dehydration-responsive element-binding protein 2C [Acorus gramineus]|uniref:Dehydration-responsive element-binding protein 2C n=1 Tax=Acorus gramineus TaxID=55184 RepID=A0AAV9B3U3_ACOGR|nr:Dehydration-responsive element-binding protein 2C [Acorus gramineus]
MKKRSRRHNSLQDVLAEWEQQHHNHLHISNNNGGNPIGKKQAKGSRRGCMKGKGGADNSSCTYRGVRQRASGKWVVEIREPNGGKRRWLGTYDTSLEAAQAYDKAAKEMYGARARLNIPLDSTSSVSETTTSASHQSDGSAGSDNVDDGLFDEELERALLMEIGDDEAGCGEQELARLNLPLYLTSVSETLTSASHHSDGSAGSDDVDNGLFDEELERALLMEIGDDEEGCGEQELARLNLPLYLTSVSETLTSASRHSDGSAGSDDVDNGLFDEELERALLMEIGDDEEGCGEQELARLNLPLYLTSVSETLTSASHHSDGSAGSDDVDDGLFDEELERALLMEIGDDEAGCGEQEHAHLNLLPLDSTSVSETTTTSDQHSDGSAGSGVSEQMMQMYEALDDDGFVEELEHLFMEECGKQELRTEEVTVPLEDFSFLDITIDPDELAALLDG